MSAPASKARLNMEDIDQMLYRKTSSRAFTIIEAMIAMVVLMIAILGLLGLLPGSMNFVNRDSQRLQAIAVAQQYLDALRQCYAASGSKCVPPAAPVIAIDPGDQFMANDVDAPSVGNFNTTGSCSLSGASTRMYDCSVSVTWTQNNASRTVSVESYVTAQI